jgi:uncharacterized protein (DUF302 family)
MASRKKIPKLIAKIPRPPGLRQILHYWLRNLLAVIGLLTLAGFLYVYLQGHHIMKQFDSELSGVMIEFIKKSLREDVASALSIKVKLRPEVSLEDAAESMKLRANQLNLPFLKEYVIHQALEQNEGEGQMRHTQIMEFCDPSVAYRISLYNPAFLAFMPCQIGLYEDAEGQGWLISMNLNLLIHGSKHMPPELKTDALSIQDTLLNIIAAGSMGAMDDPR